MNRINELESKLNNPLYKELEDIDLIDEVSKYESTASLRQLDTIKNRVDGIITNQNQKLDTLTNKEHEEDLENTLTKLNHDVDDLIAKLAVSNTIEFQKENFDMTSSALNIDDDLLKRMDKKVNDNPRPNKTLDPSPATTDVIDKIEDTIDVFPNPKSKKKDDSIIVDKDNYDFTIEDLEVETSNTKNNTGIDVISIIFIIIMLGIISLLIYVIFLA